MANIIYITDLRSNRDSDFTNTPIGYCSKRFHFKTHTWLGRQLELDVPPYFWVILEI